MIPQTKLQWLGFIAFALFERWLPKTNRIKANSTIDLCINLILFIIKVITKKEINL
jgi:hypothetical protein